MLKVKSKFEDYTPQVKQAMRANAARILARGAMAIEAQTKANIRSNDQIDTGAMLNSVQAQPGTHDLQWIVSVGVNYAGFQEWGTRFQPARPFLTPAVELHYPRILADLRDITQ